MFKNRAPKLLSWESAKDDRFAMRLFVPFTVAHVGEIVIVSLVVPAVPARVNSHICYVHEIHVPVIN